MRDPWKQRATEGVISDQICPGQHGPDFEMDLGAGVFATQPPWMVSPFLI